MISTDSILDHLENLKSEHLANQSFFEFVKQAWVYIEGNVVFKNGLHIKIICLVLHLIFF